jgi:hypothetical protein
VREIGKKIIEEEESTEPVTNDTYADADVA